MASTLLMASKKRDSTYSDCLNNINPKTHSYRQTFLNVFCSLNWLKRFKSYFGALFLLLQELLVSSLQVYCLPLQNKCLLSLVNILWGLI